MHDEDKNLFKNLLTLYGLFWVAWKVTSTLASGLSDLPPVLPPWPFIVAWGRLGDWVFRAALAGAMEGTMWGILHLSLLWALSRRGLSAAVVVSRSRVIACLLWLLKACLHTPLDAYFVFALAENWPDLLFFLLLGHVIGCVRVRPNAVPRFW